MNRLNPWRVGGATAVTAAVINVVCAAAVYLFPDGTIQFVNSWTHGLNLAVLRSDMSWTMGSLAYGLFNVGLTGFLVGALFAFLYNLMNRSKNIANK